MPFAARLFGRHIGWCAEQLPLDGHRDFTGFSLGEPKIHQVGPAGVVEHDIARFQVAMDNAQFVRVVQGLGHMQAQVGRLTGCRLLARKPIAELNPLDQVADDIDRVALVPGSSHIGNVHLRLSTI